MEILLLIGIVIYLFANSQSQSATRMRLNRLVQEVEDLKFALKTASARRSRAEDDAEEPERAAQTGPLVSEPDLTVKPDLGPVADPVAGSVAAMVEEDAAYSAAKAEASAAIEATPEARIAESPEPVPPVSARPREPKQSLEEWFAAKGLVWLGGVTIALGGVFLIKLGIDYGIFTPALQITAALIFAFSLMGLGEWLRQREGLALVGAAAGSIPVTLQNPNVRQALVGSGLFIAFAAIFGAHMLLGLIDAGPAFVAFGALAVLGLTMSVWHGIGVAYLGLAGGFLTPLLVKSDAPDPTALFVYLSALVAAICVTAQRRSWHELIFASLAGISAWTVAWTFGAALQSGEIAAPAMFILFSMASCMLAAGLWLGQAERESGTGGWSNRVLMNVCVSVCMAALYVAIVAIGGDAATVPFAFAAIAVLGVFAAAYERHAILAAIAAIWAVAYVVLWPAQPLPFRPGGFTSDLLVPLTLTFGAAFGLGGFWRLQTTSVPVLWGRVSAFTPAALYVAASFIATHWRLDNGWAAAGFGLSAAAAAACAWCLQRRETASYLEAAGAYSWALVAIAVPALALALEGPELTLAFALLLPALAWTGVTWAIPAHRVIAIVVAVLVGLRLAAEPGGWTTLEQTHPLGAWWILIGMLAPALLSFWAAREFLRERRDMTVEALEALSLLMALSFTAYAVRILMQGGVSEPSIGLVELATHALVWGFGALALERVASRTRSWTASIGMWILAALFTVGVAASLLPTFNPLFTGDSVGAFPLFNSLAYGYLAPALVGLALGWRFRDGPNGSVASAFGAAGLGLCVFWLTLETRRAFQGPVLSNPGIGDTEFYTYVLVWGVGALALERLAARLSGQVAQIGFGLLTVLFVFGVFLTLTSAFNPWFTGNSVGELPLVNDLALGYLAPALLTFVFSRRFQQSPGGALPGAFAVAGLALIGFWLSLETRRAFQGPVLSGPGFGDAEFYAYSVVWLLYSLALLALALRTKLAWLRWASLAVLTLTVAKVFGADMASLEGLWRVASFMGLGLSLVGIGALYQRFVFPQKAEAPPQQA
jgi:uncharacterized membrane protein